MTSKKKQYKLDVSQVLEILTKKNKGVSVSQRELAEKMERTKQTISDWETGKSKPKLDDIMYLLKLTGASVSTIIKEVKDV